MSLDVNVQELLKVDVEECECGGNIVPAKASTAKLFGNMKECDACGKPPINGEEVNLFSSKGMLF
ncbi:MAG: hypothetical protein ISS88_03245 [Candidatus Portnoybacteria bacterium]|nr:hypothetical protein [Candidatus Portnoybacteria bacterium]